MKTPLIIRALYPDIFDFPIEDIARRLPSGDSLTNCSVWASVIQTVPD